MARGEKSGEREPIAEQEREHKIMHESRRTGKQQRVTRRARPEATADVARWIGALACVALVSGITLDVRQARIGFFGGMAQAQQKGGTKDVSARLDAIASDLSRLEQGTLEAEMISSKFSPEERLGDGRVAHELGQYDRASYLFLDVISRTSPTSFPGYREALYLLADSLYEQRNYIGARNYLKELRDLGPGQYYQEGLGKLLEVSYATNNYEGIEGIYSEIGTSDKPALSYLRGKTLYSQGRFDEARQAFEQSAQSGEFTYKGTYYAGVSLVEQEKYAEASERFQKIASRVPERVDDYRIYNLAHMALGRIAYEQEKYSEAINHYTSVDRESRSFISAMYESAWANIQLEKFEQAEQMIDILISAEPDVNTYTAAMLLKADLSQRMEKYETALQTYDTLLEKYDPVRTQLYSFAAEHPDLREFFRGLVQDDLSLRVPGELPSVSTDFAVVPPSQWLTQNEHLERTQALINDVSMTRIDLMTAREDLRQIEARLNSGTRIKSFPKLAANTAQVITLETQLIDIQQELVDKQANEISPRLSGADASSWEEMDRELKLLRSRYEDIPGSVEGLKAREKQVDEDFKGLRYRLSEVSTQLDSLRAELDAIDYYMQTQELLLSEEETARVDELREELRGAIEVLQKEERVLRSDIEVMRQRASGGDTIDEPERKLRQKYQQKLAQAADFLANRRGSASNPSALTAIERDQGRIGPLSSRIQGYYAKMDGVIGDRTTDVYETVANLKVAINEEQMALDEAIESGRDVAGDLAYRTFLDRAYQFDQIVLRADVGKIDVLFTQKESTTEEINDLYQKRTDELRELQEAFDELR